MRLKHIILCWIVTLAIGCNSADEANTAEEDDFSTPFETSAGTETATYQQAIAHYSALSDHYDNFRLLPMGESDAGRSLHLGILDPTGDFDSEKDYSERTVFLINNGIHPGEPDGIDASMMLVRDLLQSDSLQAQLGDVLLAVIPVYNIGGSMNRNSTTRVNQEGPKSYGFRGNARNFDLNRDFIKADTKNAKTFYKIFHLLQPDVFVDTHVSNGADYQYVLSYLATQEDKLGGETGRFTRSTFIPAIAKAMEARQQQMTPYVNVFGSVPDSGYVQFYDYPRYSTGYTALFQTIGFMTETHMLKPFDQRVKATYAFLHELLKLTVKHAADIERVRTTDAATFQQAERYTTQFETDSSLTTTLNFKGYEAEMRPSAVHGKERLFYDREKPFTKPINYYNYFKPRTSVTLPEAYVIPKGQDHVIQLLQRNNINIEPILEDTSLRVTVYRIDNYKTSESPYEGHYPHYNVSVSTSSKEVRFLQGDYIVKTNQPGVRYLLETLEPTARDSFFNWNFFDSYLVSKEGFSPYVFEERAAELLKKDTTLKREVDEWLAEKTDASGYSVLQYIYQRSPHAEEAYLRYPIFRIEK